MTKRSFDAVKMYLQKQETPYYSLLPAKTGRSKHPRPLYSARYAPWYLYNPSFNFLFSFTLLLFFITWFLWNLNVGGLAGNTFGWRVSCVFDCMRGEVCVFAARCVVSTLITSWIADLGSVSERNQLHERTDEEDAMTCGEGSKLTFSAVGLGLELPGVANLGLGRD